MAVCLGELDASCRPRVVEASERETRGVERCRNRHRPLVIAWVCRLLDNVIPVRHILKPCHSLRVGNHNQGPLCIRHHILTGRVVERERSTRERRRPIGRVDFGQDNIPDLLHIGDFMGQLTFEGRARRIDGEPVVIRRLIVRGRFYLVQDIGPRLEVAENNRARAIGLLRRPHHRTRLVE